MLCGHSSCSKTICSSAMIFLFVEARVYLRGSSTWMANNAKWFCSFDTALNLLDDYGDLVYSVCYSSVLKPKDRMSIMTPSRTYYRLLVCYQI